MYCIDHGWRAGLCNVCVQDDLTTLQEKVERVKEKVEEAKNILSLIPMYLTPETEASIIQRVIAILTSIEKGE